MRYILVQPNGILDTDTGELHERLELGLLLSNGEGGVIAGRNLYALLSSLSNDIRRDSGWTMQVHAQHQRTAKRDREYGIIYYSKISYRSQKVGGRNGRRRPPAIKWLVLNLELFTESEDIHGAAKALVQLSENRGVRLRYSPGTIGSTLLRASPKWEKGRNAAPWFISEAARPYMPGNFYALRNKYKSSARALYLDQSSSHHTIASSIPLPHPAYLRARGRFRYVERAGERPIITNRWLSTPRLLNMHNHIGVFIATVRVANIPPTMTHLYPKWMMKPGEKQVWIWTPELRLLDRFVEIVRISASLTSYVSDPVISEYAQWSLLQLSDKPHPAVKSALLAAYGMLAVRSRQSYVTHSIHGRGRPPRAKTVIFPLVNGPVYRSTVERKRVPVVQNVVARGVIEAETMVRSLELARGMELQKIKVTQVYADGIIVETDQVPMLPPEWRVSAELTNVVARTPNSVLSDNLVKLPGIPNGRRTTVLKSAIIA